VVLDLLGESVRQPSKTAHSHSEAEVRAFDVAGIDVLSLGLASDYVAFAADALSGAVTLLGFRIGPVCFDQLGIVYVPVKHLLDGFQISLQAIAGELDAA
jgi:hypothetical protein